MTVSMHSHEILSGGRKTSGSYVHEHDGGGHNHEHLDDLGKVRWADTGDETIVYLTTVDQVVAGSDLARALKLPEYREREHDQQLPVPNARPFVHDALKDEVERRKQIGIERYGTPLQPFNGRNTLLDVLEEQIDGAVYIQTALIEARETLLKARDVLWFMEGLGTAHGAAGWVSAAREVTDWIERLCQRPE